MSRFGKMFKVQHMSDSDCIYTVDSCYNDSDENSGPQSCLVKMPDLGQKEYYELGPTHSTYKSRLWYEIPCWYEIELLIIRCNAFSSSNMCDLATHL